MSKIRCAIACLSVMCLMPTSSMAREGDTRANARSAAKNAKTIAPFIEDETIAVVHLDASAVEATELVAVLAPFLPAENPLLRMKDDGNRLLQTFQRAGGRELFVVISSADVPEQTPFVIVPLGDDADEKAIGALFTRAEMNDRIGDVLFVGGRETRRRLAMGSSAPRPELARALEAVGEHQVQAVFMPSAAARRVIEELLPTLPAAVGGGPTTTITRGALWIAVGADALPEPSLRLVIQSQTNDAASALRTFLMAQLRQRWPEFDRADKALLPNVKLDRLLLALDSKQIRALATMARPAIDSLSSSLRLREATGNLKRVAIAMHNYADVKKHFPPAAITDADGQPLLSWRVAVLPYLGEEALFKEFHLDEPWDSEHNGKLIDRMPAVFRAFSSAAAAGQTCYVVPVGPGSVFEGQSGTGFGQITDGTSNTLMAIEIGDEQAVIWSKPDDYKFDPKHPAEGLTSPYSEGKLVLFCDGSVHFITQPFDDETLRRILVRNDGEPIPALK